VLFRSPRPASPPHTHVYICPPDSHEIFRGIRATLSRVTLEDDGAGRRKLRVGHRALTRFLWISVTFDTGAHATGRARHSHPGRRACACVCVFVCVLSVCVCVCVLCVCVLSVCECV
jgi:hypothetical protein